MRTEDLIAKEQGLASIKKSVSVDMPSGDSEQFLVDTLKQATTLPKLKPKFTDKPSGTIPKLTVKNRQLRKHAGTNQQPTGVGGVGRGDDVPYTVEKLVWDEWIDNDEVWYNDQARGENTEEKLVNLLQGQFGVDLQDLAFNGDKMAKLADGVTADPFLSIIDGFVKKIKTQSTLKTDLAANDWTFVDFASHTLLLDEKYLNLSDVTWVMSRKTYQRCLAKALTRETGLGDHVLVNGELTKIAGYPIEIVQGLQDHFVVLTPLSNLRPVFTRQVRYARVGDDSTAVAKDATYHNIVGHMDAVLVEPEAAAWMVGDKL